MCITGLRQAKTRRLQHSLLVICFVLIPPQSPTPHSILLLTESWKESAQFLNLVFHVGQPASWLAYGSGSNSVATGPSHPVWLNFILARKGAAASQQTNLIFMLLRGCISVCPDEILHILALIKARTHTHTARVWIVIKFYELLICKLSNMKNTHQFLRPFRIRWRENKGVHFPCNRFATWRATHRVDLGEHKKGFCYCQLFRECGWKIC